MITYLVCCWNNDGTRGEYDVEIEFSDLELAKEYADHEVDNNNWDEVHIYPCEDDGYPLIKEEIHYER